MTDLSTTNLLLGIMAVASALQVLMLIGAGIFAYVEYRRVTQVVADLEARQLAPLREKIDRILADVHEVTARVSHQTERVDHAITGTMDRVDETAERVRSSMRDKVAQAVGVVRGVRAIIMSMMYHESRPKPHAAAEGRA